MSTLTKKVQSDSVGVDSPWVLIRIRIRALKLGFNQLVKLIRIWQKRTAQRRALAELSAYQRQDIGISLSDVNEEVSKPFWKP